MLPILVRAAMLAKKAKDAAPRKLSSSEKEPGKFNKDELRRLREGDSNVKEPRFSDVDRQEINPDYVKQMNRVREKSDKADPDIESKLMRNEELPFSASPRQYKKGGSASSASSRADGIAQRGKTKGRIV